MRPRKVNDRDVQTLLLILRDLEIKNVDTTMNNVVEKSGLSLEMAS